MKILKIRLERQKRNWTLDYVAKGVGLSKTAIYDIETGRRKPSYDVLIKLCNLFEVNTNELEDLFKNPQLELRE